MVASVYTVPSSGPSPATTAAPSMPAQIDDGREVVVIVRSFSDPQYLWRVSAVAAMADGATVNAGIMDEVRVGFRIAVLGVRVTAMATVRTCLMELVLFVTTMSVSLVAMPMIAMMSVMLAWVALLMDLWPKMRGKSQDMTLLLDPQSVGGHVHALKVLLIEAILSFPLSEIPVVGVIVQSPTALLARKRDDCPVVRTIALVLGFGSGFDESEAFAAGLVP